MTADPARIFSLRPSPATSENDSATGGSPIGARAYLGTFGTSVFIQVCTALQSVLIARLLGPAGRGEFAAIVLWPTAFAGLGLFGANMAIARRAGRMEALPSLTKTAVALSFLASATTVTIGYFLLPYLLPKALAHLLPVAGMFLAFIPLNQFATNLQSVDLGSGNFRLLNLSRGVLYPVFIVGLIVIWLSGSRELAWVIVALLLGEGALVLTLSIAKRRQLGSTAELLAFGPLVREGLPYGLVGIGDLFYQRADQMLLLWLLSSRDLGLYVVGLAAAGALSSIPLSMGMVSFTEAAQADPRTGFERIAKAFRRTLIVSVLAGGALAVAIPVLLPTLYGQAFLDSVPVAFVLITGTVLAGLAQVVDQCLRGSGRPLVGMAARTAAIGTMAIAGYLLSTVWGVLGIAAAFVAAQVVYLLLLVLGAVSYYEQGSLPTLVPGIGDFRELSSVAKEIFRKLYREDVQAT